MKMSVKERLIDLLDSEVNRCMKNSELDDSFEFIWTQVDIIYRSKSPNDNSVTLQDIIFIGNILNNTALSLIRAYGLASTYLTTKLDWDTLGPLEQKNR